ncbi:uncharacterized protein HMPREF1541_02226 [Cyphellophora europaea CBS 101466]|uniref:RlpA-like protein double-psi beta-barrel domain-containing protein n=1 Tax=Cyphellophora europaea (strain CBS 101466) TaxID=1220924 RepID=W2S4U9_CYPE1|nr:uncharacterized protein HMPREF1541_02226 [Cyphellophora europaea CBS 101466]ETN43068.1 hypothetical protein HMPREF1541_02226 [Cyphellophora europaea CBS 101466]
MAPMKNILAALALASYVSAVPMAVDRRAEMVTETEWVTVETTTTVWVNEPSPAAQAENTPPKAAAAVTTSAPAPPAATTPAAAAAPAPVAPQDNAAPAAFAEQPQAAQPSAPAVSSSAAVVQQAPPASTPTVQPKTAGASSGGPCEGEGSACTGDVTHYDGGLGACGWNVDTASDMAIALPHGLMGTQSNGNPYCGRSLSIKASDGSVVKATVGDKCMGCEGQSIDLTDKLFAAVVPNGDGRVSGVEWWFD